MQRRRPNPSHLNIQIVIHNQSLLQQIQTELATDVKLLTQEVTRKYAKHSRHNVVIAKKLVTMKNAAGRQAIFQRNKCTSPVQFPLQLRLLQLQVLQHKFHWNIGMKMANSTKRSTCCQHLPRKSLLIQFDIGREINSVNSKVILKVDTGADMNALNRSTFKSLFSQVQLQPSNIILKNFNATSVRNPFSQNRDH